MCRHNPQFTMRRGSRGHPVNRLVPPMRLLNVEVSPKGSRLQESWSEETWTAWWRRATSDWTTAASPSATGSPKYCANIIRRHYVLLVHKRWKVHYMTALTGCSSPFDSADGYNTTMSAIVKHYQCSARPVLDMVGSIHGLDKIGWVDCRHLHGNGNPTGMGIKHRNGNGREWETRSMEIGITCTPMGMRIPVGICYL